ncbi:hypothetical protein [Sphingomicrobium aestuariivivum]|uniref:hypothetical protein n=1 Tax=Sphingomicrobium aestuariivivum TaxID=1582356 RepID=UPI001FD6BC56|nr:hypothetical protein [Sphingomicrobium aestuariivivum]MCJ8190224.1 hypothetical protein [Sphingomicrobium aestuariivivum]
MDAIVWSVVAALLVLAAPFMLGALAAGPVGIGIGTLFGMFIGIPAAIAFGLLFFALSHWPWHPLLVPVVAALVPPFLLWAQERFRWPLNNSDLVGMMRLAAIAGLVGGVVLVRADPQGLWA